MSETASFKKRFFRTGANARQGWVVTFKDIAEQFGFKQCRVGKWITKKEQEDSAQLFYDAFFDLKNILKGPVELISLRGHLSVDYGIGGSYGTAAHYSPSDKTMALAKNAGPGCIAHEWFHAFDDYIAEHTFPDSDDFASQSFFAKKPVKDHPINQQLSHLYDVIFFDQNGKHNDYVRRAKEEDQRTRVKYYALPYELAARAFEAFVQDQPIKNNFLVSGTKASADAKKGLYPMGEHRRKINRAFENYFNLLGFALLRQKEKENSSGVTLFMIVMMSGNT